MKNSTKILRRLYFSRVASQNIASTYGAAKELGISQSYVSQLLAGRRTLSYRIAARAISAWSLDVHEGEELLSALQCEDRRGRVEAEEANVLAIRKRHREFDGTLALDQSAVLGDWYHLPMANLVTTDTFRNHLPWIARRFGLTVADVRSSLALLVEIGLVVREGKTFRVAKRRLLVEKQKFKLEAGRYVARMFEKSAEALLSAVGNDTNQIVVSSSIALDPAHLEEARALVSQFVNDLGIRLSGGRTTEVFQMNVHFLKLTRPAG